jgi:hypothetical protein
MTTREKPHGLVMLNLVQHLVSFLLDEEKED